MGGSRHGRPGVGQEEFLLDFNPEIPSKFSRERALAAADRRKRRRGSLALTERSKNFLKNVDHLFIPYSTSEIDMVIHPSTKVRTSKYHAKERVKEKYKDQQIAEGRVEGWANFAAKNAEINVMAQVRGFRTDARASFIRLCQGLTSSDLTFDRKSIFGSPEALQELCRYVYTLKTFVGFSEDEVPVKRKFVQDRWVRKIAEHTAWAMDYIQGLVEPRQLELYDEALHNSWSRDEHWNAFLGSFTLNVRRGQSPEPDFIEVPDWLYDNDPEAVMPPDFSDPVYDIYFPYSSSGLHDIPPSG